MSKGGRPTVYRSDLHPTLASYWAQEGLTELQMAERLGVTSRTISAWKVAHPEFLQALKTTKDEADSKVIESLYQQAVKGNVTAQIFWLKNRQPDKWRDAWKIEQSGTLKVEGKLDVSLERVIEEYGTVIRENNSRVPAPDGSR